MVIESFKYTIPQITYLVKKKLWAQVLAGLFFGLILGIILGPEANLVPKESVQSIAEWLSIPANLFLKIIQMIIIPLIFASIIRGLTSTGSMEQLRSIGIGATAYFIITTIIAIGIGVLVATTIMPGNFIDSSLIFESFGIEETENTVEQADFSLADIPQGIVGFIPSNPPAINAFRRDAKHNYFCPVCRSGIDIATKEELRTDSGSAGRGAEHHHEGSLMGNALGAICGLWFDGRHYIKTWNLCNRGTGGIHGNCCNRTLCDACCVCNHNQVFHKKSHLVQRWEY